MPSNNSADDSSIVGSDPSELSRTPFGDTNLTVGTEVEAPLSESGSVTYTDCGYSSSSIVSDLRTEYGGRTQYPDGEIGRDPTAGIEIRSYPMSTEELADWYDYTVRNIRETHSYEPTGYAGPDSGATSFGLHIHISPLSRSTAEALYELSILPWFQNFVCTSITREHTAQVFRSSYCGMSFDPGPRSSNNVVTMCEPEENHWEWRMPEPMEPENFNLVMRFLELLQSEGKDAAKEYAKTFVYSADDALTSVKRAKACDISSMFTNSGETDISRQPDHDSTELAVDFYNEVSTSAYRPYIYTVTHNGESYYAMYSSNYADDETFSDMGVEYTANEVLRTDDLNPVTDSAVVDTVRQFVIDERDNVDHSDSPDKSKATDALLEVLEQAGSIDAAQTNENAQTTQ